MDTLAHITIIDTKDGINKYPYHKQILFTFPEITRTTISNKRNSNCDNVIVREVVMPHEGEERSEDDDKEGEDMGQEA